ncbi:MAG: hypothetical protein JOY60_08400 [Burkholderiaceae bacterium]|nr:hypothetical protein [Burkholderiaceae bacterium]
MNPLLYLETVTDHLVLYLALLGLMLLPHWWLVRRIAVNIFDPLFLVILADWFGATIVTFMWLMDDITVAQFSYYTCSQMAFASALLMFRRHRRPLPAAIHEPQSARQMAFYLLLSSGCLQVLATAVKWTMTGIPLFNVSRLGAFVDSGGFGIIERFETGALYILAFTAFHVWRFPARRWQRSVALAALLWLVVYTVFSGSKSALLGLMQIYFAHSYLYAPVRSRSFWGSQLGGKAFAAAGGFALLILLVQSQGNLIEALGGLAIRLVSFGDVYIYAYIDNTMQSLSGTNPFIGLFGGFLSTFRLIPADWLYKNIGLQLSDLIFPGLDYLMGPNPRHNVFGFHFFAWWGLTFSFALGAFIVALQGRLFHRRPRRFMTVLWSFLLYFSLVSASGDFDYAMSSLASLLITAGLVIVPVHLLTRPSKPLQPTALHAST